MVGGVRVSDAGLAEIERLRRRVRELEQRVANQADTIRHERFEALRWRDAYQQATGSGWKLDVEGFPARLCRLRAARRLTQSDLAELVGVTGPSICLWEKGRVHPRWSSVPRLAEALGVTAAELLGAERR